MACIKGGHKRPYKLRGRGQIAKQYKDHCRAVFMSGGYPSADGTWRYTSTHLSIKIANAYDAQRERASHHS